MQSEQIMELRPNMKVTKWIQGSNIQLASTLPSITSSGTEDVKGGINFIGSGMWAGIIETFVSEAIFSSSKICPYLVLSWLKQSKLKNSHFFVSKYVDKNQLL